MLSAQLNKRTLFWVYLVSLGIGAISFLAGLLNFYYIFLVPVFFAMCLYGIFRTDRFILLLGAIAPLSINITDIGGGIGMSVPTEPILLLVFFGLCVKFCLGNTLPTRILLHPLSLAIGAYLIWLWISTLFSSMPLVSAKFCLARTIYIVVFYYALIIIFRDFRNIHFFLVAFCVFTLGLIIFTLSKHAADGFVRSSSYSISWPFFPDHGMYAACIAFIAPVLALYAFAGRAFKTHIFWMLAAGFFFIVSMFGILVSYTRATWLSLIVALGIFIILQFKVRFKWIVLGLGIVAVVGIMKQDEILYSLSANKQGSSDELEGHVKSVSNISTDPSNLERLNRWSSAARMVKERPVFGYGPGTFVFQYSPFQKSNETTIISTFAGDMGDAHSEYFSALSETGWPGFLLWIGLVLTSMGIAFRVILNSGSRAVRITAYMALLGLVSYYFHAFLNNYSQYDKLAVPLWSFMAIIAALDLYFLPHTQKKKPQMN